MSTIKITELQEIQAVSDSSFIPVDDGSLTRKISVGNFNESSNTTAKMYAEQAAESAASASASVASATEKLEDMDRRLTNVETMANTVSSLADEVTAHAESANNAAISAAGSASTATMRAQEASESASEVDQAALLAESWAKGGTGIRDGEDTNNAAYYARQAGSSVSGGVLSFNGRGGNVNPEPFDYSADQIRRGTSSVDTDLGAVETAVQTAQTTANNAGSAASAAQTTADNAASAASAAQISANNAQTTADNAQSAVNTTNTRITNAHKQFLHSFTNGNWELVSGGTWDGYYRSIKSGRTIHNPSGTVRASGTTLDAPPSDAIKSAVSSMYFEIDDTANTLTAYAKTAPTTAIYVAVEGVE